MEIGRYVGKNVFFVEGSVSPSCYRCDVGKGKQASPEDYSFVM